LPWQEERYGWNFKDGMQRREQENVADCTTDKWNVGYSETDACKKVKKKKERVLLQYCLLSQTSKTVKVCTK